MRKSAGEWEYLSRVATDKYLNEVWVKNIITKIHEDMNNSNEKHHAKLPIILTQNVKI